MRKAGNVNSQVMSDMDCSITTVEGLDAILEVVDDAGRAASLFLNSNLARLQKFDRPKRIASTLFAEPIASAIHAGAPHFM